MWVRSPWSPDLRRCAVLIPMAHGRSHVTRTRADRNKSRDPSVNADICDDIRFWGRATVNILPVRTSRTLWPRRACFNHEQAAKTFNRFEKHPISVRSAVSEYTTVRCSRSLAPTDPSCSVRVRRYRTLVSCLSTRARTEKSTMRTLGIGDLQGVLSCVRCLQQLVELSAEFDASRVRKYVTSAS